MLRITKTILSKTLMLMLLFLTASAIDSAAQDYDVYSVRGEVKLIRGRSKSPIKLRDKITDEQIVSIPQSGMIMLLDKTGKKLYTINRPCTGKVKTLLTEDKASVKNLSNQYLKYLLAQLKGKGSIMTETAYMQRTASAYRDADSLLIATDSAAAEQVMDSVKCDTGK